MHCRCWIGPQCVVIVRGGGVGVFCLDQVSHLSQAAPEKGVCGMFTNPRNLRPCSICCRILATVNVAWPGDLRR